MANKTWKKPELTVIVRSRPEESVLEGCKSHIPNTGPDYVEWPCMGDNQQGAGSTPSCRGYSGT